MNTDNLIAALAADAKLRDPPIGRTLLAAAGIGAILAAVLFFLGLPLRPDLADLLGTPRFLFKWVLTGALLISALLLALRLARPEPLRGSELTVLVVAPAVLFVGIVHELTTQPPDEWARLMIGHNARVCLVVIPLLSALPLASLLLALRRGAPSRPALAGAVAGLAAAGIGATLYAAHCTDDSPLFLAAWYVIATLIVAGAGALLGARLLRW